MAYVIIVVMIMSRKHVLTVLYVDASAFFNRIIYNCVIPKQPL